MGVNGYVITTRAEGTVLTGFGSSSDIFNNDHLNHVTHTAPNFINSWEDTLAHMQATTDPNPASLPAAFFEELQRLRFAFARLKQRISGAATPPFWYTATSSFSNGVSISPSAARLERTAPQLFNDAVFTQVLFDTVVYDTVPGIGMHVGAALVAPADGVYAIGASMLVGDVTTTGPTGVFQLRIRTTHLSTDSDVAAESVISGSSEPKAIVVDTVKHLFAGDTVTVLLFQNSGSVLNVTAPVSKPAMWAALLGRN